MSEMFVPHQLRDPAGALHSLHRHARLRPGHVQVGLFADPAEHQHLLGSVQLADSTDPPGDRDLPARTERAIGLLRRRLPTQPIAVQLVFVVARLGAVVFRAGDLRWVAALWSLDRRVLAPLIADGQPELMLITEHGFRCWTDATAGHHPALRPGRPPRERRRSAPVHAPRSGQTSPARTA